MDLLDQAETLLSELPGGVVLPTCGVKPPQPLQRREELGRALHVRTQLPSAGIGCAHLRSRLALGGDQAIRINATSDDSYFIAAQIADIAKEGNYDLILTGKETIDYNSSSLDCCS